MEELIIFVYAKDGKIKVLSLNESLALNKELLEDGWIHTKTLNACVYIQHLHNDCEYIIDEVLSLKTRD